MIAVSITVQYHKQTLEADFHLSNDGSFPLTFQPELNVLLSRQICCNQTSFLIWSPAVVRCLSPASSSSQLCADCLLKIAVALVDCYGSPTNAIIPLRNFTLSLSLSLSPGLHATVLSRIFHPSLCVTYTERLNYTEISFLLLYVGVKLGLPHLRRNTG